jgi:hypothetical protein
MRRLSHPPLPILRYEIRSCFCNIYAGYSSIWHKKSTGVSGAFGKLHRGVQGLLFVLSRLLGVVSSSVLALATDLAVAIRFCLACNCNGVGWSVASGETLHW